MERWGPVEILWAEVVRVDHSGASKRIARLRGRRNGYSSAVLAGFVHGRQIPEILKSIRREILKVVRQGPLHGTLDDCKTARVQPSIELQELDMIGTIYSPRFGVTGRVTALSTPNTESQCKCRVFNESARQQHKPP